MLFDCHFICSICLKYSGVFPNSHLSTHAISVSLLHSVSRSVNPLLSISLTLLSDYYPLCFYLPLFYTKGNWFGWSASLNILRPNMSSSERALRHQQNWRIWDQPKLIGSWLVLLVCIDKNTQVFDFTNSHFWPSPSPFPTNTLSLTLLIHYSLSLSPSLSSDSPLCFRQSQLI
jgi:hypothetical protein